jgi:hypothetical protein
MEIPRRNSPHWLARKPLLASWFIRRALSSTFLLLSGPVPKATTGHPPRWSLHLSYFIATFSLISTQKPASKATKMEREPDHVNPAMDRSFLTANIADVVEKMTTNEKIQLLAGDGWWQ